MVSSEAKNGFNCVSCGTFYRDERNCGVVRQHEHPARGFNRYGGCQGRVSGTHQLLARCSGDLLPPSPPAEKATASKDQAGKASTSNGAGHRKLPCSEGHRRHGVRMEAACKRATLLIRAARVIKRTDRS